MGTAMASEDKKTSLTELKLMAEVIEWKGKALTAQLEMLKRDYAQVQAQIAEMEKQEAEPKTQEAK